MQFVLILAVVAALVAAECAPAQPVSGAGARLMIACGAIGLVALFAAATSVVFARRLQADCAQHQLLLKRFRNVRRLHVALWLLTAGGILFGLGWGQIVRFNWHLDRAFLLDDLLILMPVLLPLVLSWAAFYEVDRAVRLAAGDGAAMPGPLTSRSQYLALHARHYLGILLVPVLVLLAVQDAVELFAPAVLRQGCEAAVFLPLLAALFLFFPLLLRFVWQTQPLPAGPLRSRLETAAADCHFHAREILVWRTGGMVVNAAVAGVVRPLRYVFLSDGLLRDLDDEEIEAVFAHEVGHVRHRHLLLRLLAMIAPLSLGLLAQQALPEWCAGFERWLALMGPSQQLPAGLAALAAMAFYMLVVFGYYSRLLEHQADWFACRRLGTEDRHRAVETFSRALEKLAAGSGIGRTARGWQHASIARRIEFLLRLSSTPKSERRSRWQLRLLGMLWIGIALGPVIWRLLLG